MTTSEHNNPFIKVSSPSNIAFVKYWGKYGEQLPINPSLSMTLKECVSIFNIEFISLNDNIINDFKFEDSENLKFKERLNLFLSKYKNHFPVLLKYSINIKCSNTFPHSSGIASSASAMSAIVYALISFNLKGKLNSTDLQKASELSRLASGSASRSLFPGLVQWGENELPLSSDEYAIEFKDVHASFKTLLDSVLIIDSSQKEFSSSFGHSLMEKHPFKDARVAQANENIKNISKSIRNGDFKEFGRILESEALTLHGLMMSSNPSMLLLKPNSLKAIELVKVFRDTNNLDLFFTIDAGANIHLLYPDSIKKDVLCFIDDSLKSLCIDGRVIHDSYGEGPKILEAVYDI